MKKIILLFAFLCASVAASWAQELKIKSFKPTPIDLYAKLHPVKDLNGEDCALVRVKIAKKDIQFGGHVLKVEVKSGEYFVWMPAGMRYLKIWDPEFRFIPLMVDFKELLRKKEKIEGGKGYSLVLEVPERAGEVHLTIENLYLSTTKEAANITPAAGNTAASEAKELKVAAFTKAPFDPYARQHPVKDINGEDCALVRVKIDYPANKLIFGGDNMGEVKQVNGDFMVWMPAGSRYLTISETENSFLPFTIDFKELLGPGEKLQSKYVYNLLLQVPERAGDGK